MDRLTVGVTERGETLPATWFFLGGGAKPHGVRVVAGSNPACPPSPSHHSCDRITLVYGPMPIVALCSMPSYGTGSDTVSNVGVSPKSGL